MKTNNLYKYLGLAFASLLFTACASNSEIPEEDGMNEEEAAEEITESIDENAVNGEELQAEGDAITVQETVFYFDFDQSTLKEEGKPALIAHAKKLAGSESARVVLEGHADERGTTEYNLALGERRALTVRRFLMANGANVNQIKVHSFGEERPAVMGQNEDAYAKNRRVEIKYQSN